MRFKPKPVRSGWCVQSKPVNAAVEAPRSKPDGVGISRKKLACLCCQGFWLGAAPGVSLCSRWRGDTRAVRKVQSEAIDKSFKLSI